MSTNNRPPSMTDVAKLAGVSYQTVSRVLNSPDRVANKTRSKVEAAISQLGYRPNQAARMLKTNRSHMIGVIYSDPHLFGPSSTLNGIYEAAQDTGYGVQVGIISKSGKKNFVTSLRSLLSHGVEGVIIITTRTWVTRCLGGLLAGTPAVVVSAGLKPATQVSVVSVDQYKGACLAVNHLIENGYTNINHLSGPLDWYDAKFRLKAWQSLIKENPKLSGSMDIGDWSEKSGYDYAAKLYPKFPQSIFMANDQMAIGALRFFYEKGIRVPEDIALVGFDNIDYGTYSCPSLTSIQQPFTQVGETALQLLLGHLKGNQPMEIRISPRLIVRESSQNPKRS